jgi:hypothetical protein
MYKTDPAEEMLHFILTVADQREDGLDPVVFSRFGELSDEFLGNPLGAVCWGRPRLFRSTLRSQVIQIKFTGAPQHKPNEPIIELGNQRGPVRPIGLGDFSILFSRYAARAIRSGAPPC